MEAALCRALGVPCLDEHVSAFLRAPPSAAEEVLRLCLVPDQKGPYSVSPSHPRVQALCAMRVCLLCALGGGPVTEEDLRRDGKLFASPAGGVVCSLVLGPEGLQEETQFEPGKKGTAVLCRLFSFLMWGPGADAELAWKCCTREWVQERAPEFLCDWTDQEWQGGEVEWRAAADALTEGDHVAWDLEIHVLMLGQRKCRPPRAFQWTLAEEQPALEVTLEQLRELTQDAPLLDGLGWSGSVFARVWTLLICACRVPCGGPFCRHVVAAARGRGVFGRYLLRRGLVRGRRVL